ncbi:MAG: chorismate synthase [Bacteroidales bacterium]|jgi:chorismate synthase|nr:chorismate synthase [Bacteroidales bacterium]
MSGNTLGKIFKLTTFGESHGSAIGGVIDGCPAGLSVDFEYIQQQLQERKIDPLAINSRKEEDAVEFFSGIFEGKTTGTPIGFLIANKDLQEIDYQQEKTILKPSHAHYVYWKKYGIFDHRGGGRASARETASRVVGGCFADMLIRQYNIEIETFTLQIGKVCTPYQWTELLLEKASENVLHCPDKQIAKEMLNELQNVKDQQDTVGCVVGGMIKNVPIGLGSPVFDKLSADLGKALLSINATKGFQYGAGFEAAGKYGSQINDKFDENFRTKTNYSGGIQAGISNGENIYFSVAFKPLPTLSQTQQSVDIYGKEAVLQPKGRHDICAAPRVRAVIKAMTAMTIADHLLQYLTYSK